MVINPLALTIRTKIIGALIRDGRLAANKTIDECAQAIGVSSELLREYELGNRSISLPELEGISFFLRVPLEHFWERETIPSGNKGEQPPNISQLISIRQKMIGALLRQARLEEELSLETLAENTKIDPALLETYELGEVPIPLPELEMLSGVLKRSIRKFQDQYGPVGLWNTQQHILKDFQNLPPELQTFVCKPINRPYLELAVRLSEMPVDRLRSVAEGLLEITF